MIKPKIFIAHGHDTAGREELEFLLHRLDLDPFILQNTANSSMTIIEALESYIYSGVDFGIVLLTPDDVAHSVANPTIINYRARQNVILELGMLMAAISRKNIAILKKGNIEVPSDLNGIFYYEYSSRIKEVAGQLCDCMIKSGIPIDPIKITRVIGGL